MKTIKKLQRLHLGKMKNTRSKFSGGTVKQPTSYFSFLKKKKDTNPQTPLNK